MLLLSLGCVMSVPFLSMPPKMLFCHHQLILPLTSLLVAVELIVAFFHCQLLLLF